MAFSRIRARSQVSEHQATVGIKLLVGTTGKGLEDRRPGGPTGRFFAVCQSEAEGDEQTDSGQWPG